MAANYLFLSLSLGWMVAQIGHQIFPPLLPDTIEEFSITSFEAGIALSLL